jgi:hypothetical protein
MMQIIRFCGCRLSRSEILCIIYFSKIHVNLFFFFLLQSTHKPQFFFNWKFALSNNQSLTERKDFIEEDLTRV